MQRRARWLVEVDARVVDHLGRERCSCTGLPPSAEPRSPLRRLILSFCLHFYDLSWRLLYLLRLASRASQRLANRAGFQPLAPREYVQHRAQINTLRSHRTMSMPPGPLPMLSRPTIPRCTARDALVMSQMCLSRHLHLLPFLLPRAAGALLLVVHPPSRHLPQPSVLLHLARLELPQRSRVHVLPVVSLMSSREAPVAQGGHSRKAITSELSPSVMKVR